MPIEEIEYGSLASSQVLNNNFEVLSDRITDVAEELASGNSSIYSSIAGINSTVSQMNQDLSADISQINTSLTALRNDFDAVDITPNYSQAVTVVNSSGSGSYNIDFDGWLAFDLYCNQNSAKFQFYIDDVMVGATASDEGDRAAGIVMVKSGSVASWNGSQSIVIKSIPFVGG